MVGAGPAGLACATALAERGHRVTLFERAHEIGGQFRYAREVPGKEDFHDTLRYFARRIELTGVRLELNTTADAALLGSGSFDEIVIVEWRARAHAARSPASIIPRSSRIPDLLSGRARGRRVAWPSSAPAASASTWPRSSRIGADDDYFAEWGIDRTLTHARRRGAARGRWRRARRVYLLQRKAGRLGRDAGQDHGVDPSHGAQASRRGHARRRQLPAHRRCGLAHLDASAGRNCWRSITSSSVPGQESVNGLAAELAASGKPVHVIGGALLAAELDAERAIREGVMLAARI